MRTIQLAPGELAIPETRAELVACLRDVPGKTLVVKDHTIDKAPLIVDEANQVLRFAITTEAKDRDGDTVALKGWDWKNYLANPVALWAHDSHQPPIAKALNIGVDKGAVVCDDQFIGEDIYPFAAMIYRMYLGGFLRAVSVGFLPKTWDWVEREDGSAGFDFSGQELLEHSAVAVPSNPEALVRAVTAGVADGDMLVRAGFDYQRPTIEVSEVRFATSDPGAQIVNAAVEIGQAVTALTTPPKDKGYSSLFSGCYEEAIERVWRAVYHTEMGWDAWVVATWPDRTLICHRGERYLLASYDVDENGDVTFGEWAEVAMEIVPKDALIQAMRGRLRALEPPEAKESRRNAAEPTVEDDDKTFTITQTPPTSPSAEQLRDGEGDNDTDWTLEDIAQMTAEAVRVARERFVEGRLAA